MKNANAMILAAGFLLRAQGLRGILPQVPKEARPLIEDAACDLESASQQLQTEAGYRINITPAGDAPIKPAPVKSRSSGATGKRKVGGMVPGRGVVTQYMDVPGGFGTSEAHVWSAIVSPSAQRRCEAAGISVKKEWMTSFKAFLTDMGYKPHPTALLVRKNKKGNYEPENMTWRANGDDLAGRQTKPRNWGKKS